MSSRTGRRVVWLLTIITVVGAVRYFLTPVPLLRPPLPSFIPRNEEAMAGQNIAPYLLENHRGLFLTHVGCGIVAISLGLVQFIAALRNARPAIHRKLGMVYCAAVLVGGTASFPLAIFLIRAAPPDLRNLFLPVIPAFLTLAVAWLWTTGVAFVRARQGRLDEHRAWMIRSYSITFAAASTRVMATVFVLVTQSVALAVPMGLWTWPLNLLVAQWIIRGRSSAPAAAVTPA